MLIFHLENEICGEWHFETIAIGVNHASLQIINFHQTIFFIESCMIGRTL
mgnify:CR=1 FL=1